MSSLIASGTSFFVTGNMVTQANLLGDSAFNVLTMVVEDTKNHYVILPLWYAKDSEAKVKGSIKFEDKYDWSDFADTVLFDMSGSGNNVITFKTTGDIANTIATITLESNIGSMNNGISGQREEGLYEVSVGVLRRM